ncbi:MAG: hypothetical protein COY53_01750 [Elusimicrobia bacterium CG_4_10_14_0_8_um_filter_37_32]|nr:MAG: hypothetical protein COY53_01750 [Elusimicrobia bacterium CG_4_10_14_0_8_um_filter_37_32]
MRTNWRQLILNALRYYRGFARIDQIYSYIKTELKPELLDKSKFQNRVKNYLKLLVKEGKTTRDGQWIYRIAPGLLSDGNDEKSNKWTII